jgi:hypothetical protein
VGKSKRHRKAAESTVRDEPRRPRARAPVDVEPPLDLPPPEQRKRINLLISLVLAASVFIPATYYMNDDRRDERYAWRMFSAQRAEVCDAKVVEQRVSATGTSTRHDLNLVVTIHQAWVSGLKLGRPDIVQRFFDYRCEQPEVHQVVLTRDCRSGAGRPLPVDVLTHDCPGKSAPQAAAAPTPPAAPQGGAR